MGRINESGMDRYEQSIRICWYSLVGIVILIILACLTGCRTKYVAVPEYHTEYVNKHDTVLTHDSIYQQEFVDRYVQGDTVYLTKTKVVYRIRYLYRTKNRDSIRTDSIRVPYPVERKLSRWQQAKMDYGGAAMGGTIVALCFIVVWLVKRFRK